MSASRYLVFGGLLLLGVGCQVDQSLGDIEEAGGEAGEASGGSDRADGAGGRSGSGGATSGGATSGGASSGGAGASSGAGSGVGENGGAGPGGSSGDEILSIVATDGFSRTPPPACESGTPEERWCVGTASQPSAPVGCAVPGEVISFTANDDVNCPFCAAPPAGDLTRACPDARTIYHEFVWDLVSPSCANFCESDADCFAWEVKNACGDIVVSLYGLEDEEPLAFMEEYAATHCGACGTAAQEMYLRRPGSSRIEFGAPMGSLLEGFESRCVERQCVLARY